jgi:hypothetical protein
MCLKHQGPPHTEEERAWAETWLRAEYEGKGWVRVIEDGIEQYVDPTFPGNEQYATGVT